MKKQFLQFKQAINQEQQAPETENGVGGAGNAQISGANEQKDASQGETAAQKASRETREELEKNGTAKVQASKAENGQLTGFESSTGTGHRV